MSAPAIRRRPGPAGPALIALALASAPVAAQSGVGTPGAWLLRGGSVWTSNGQLMQADVLIRDGRIASVGTLGPVSGAQEIDARGQRIYPGLWDSFTPMGLAEIGGIATMNLRSEVGDFNPHNRAIVAINVESEMIAITRSNGVTNVITAPSGGVLSGQAAALHLAGWTWEDMTANAAAAWVVNYPRGGGGRGGGFGPPPSPEQERAASERVNQQVAALRAMLRTAKAYDEARRAGSRAFDLKLESLRPLVRGEGLALVAADREAEIRGAVELADSFGIRVAIQGGDEAWKAADLLARKNVPVILGSLQSTPANDAPYDAIYAQPGVLHRAGVRIAFSTGAASNARHVPYSAALAVAYGLPADAAMHALTLWPAEIFGLGSQLGSVEAGKVANLFLADGDPLDVRTRVSAVFIKGRNVPIDDRHTRLYQKWNARPRGGG
jgi:imidazolonepropionase-like amidohydrolase